jgi:uncharacterized caspase-like protein
MRWKRPRDYSSSGDEGVSLNDVMQFANDSLSKNRIIILDSCYSGTVAASGSVKKLSEISEGKTILTASTAEQYANEENGHPRHNQPTTERRQDGSVRDHSLSRVY